MSAFADQVITISANQTDQIAIGAMESPSTETTTVIVNEGVTVDYAGIGENAAVFLAYMSGSANISLDNSGYLSSNDRGVFAMNVIGSTGGISVINQATGNILAEQDYGVYMLSANNQTLQFANYGEIGGSAISYSEEYAGAVVLQSEGGGNASFVNTGIIVGNDMQTGQGVATFATSGSVDINNSGTISSFNNAGTGILIASNVNGGTLTNTGAIEATTAIDVKGKNVSVKLRVADADTTNTIAGNIVLASGSNNNTLSVYAQKQVNIEGDVSIGSGNNLEIVLADAADGLSFLNASGTVDISGVNLVFDTTGASFQIGDVYELINANEISGWFSSIVGAATSEYDPDQIYSVGGYDVVFGLSGGTFSMTVVPEPSTVAAILGTLALGFAAYRRRKA